MTDDARRAALAETLVRAIEEAALHFASHKELVAVVARVLAQEEPPSLPDGVGDIVAESEAKVAVFDGLLSKERAAHGRLRTALEHLVGQWRETNQWQQGRYLQLACADALEAVLIPSPEEPVK